MKIENLQFIPNAPSTNELMKEMVQKAESSEGLMPNYFAIYTDFQTCGRGMGSNRWHSDSRLNLLTSIFLRPTPQIEAARQFRLNQYFTLQVREVVARRIPDVQIKWPNDIYVGGKKIAGILIEHTLRGNQLQHTIAGLGLNVNQKTFPSDIPNPTSIQNETGLQTNPVTLLEELLTLLKKNANIIYSDTLDEEYISHLYRYNEPHNYRIFGERIRATIRGLDPYGQLQLEDSQGRLYTCGFKEVKFEG